MNMSGFGFLKAYRIILFSLAFAAASWALITIASDDVRAPLLTMLGGIMLLAALFPPIVPRWSSWSGFIGTLWVTVGSWFWLKTVNDDAEYITGLGIAAIVLFVAAAVYFPLMTYFMMKDE